jgi:predicted transcriptional regulator
MPKTVTLRLDEDVYRELREAAAAERRPLSNLIETAALAKVRETQFVDDAEMAEILGNEDLMRRLKAGSRQARRRKGRVVE